MINIEKAFERRINKWLLRFDQKHLESEYRNSQTQHLSRYSAKLFLMALIPLVCAISNIVFSQDNIDNPIKLYTYNFILLFVLIFGIVMIQFTPHLYEWIHCIIALFLNGFVCWQLSDDEVSIFVSIGEFYKGFLIGSIYLMMYLSCHFITKVFLILSINVSLLFFLPRSSTNVWIIIIAQIVLIIIVSLKAYYDDYTNRQLFLSQRKQNIQDNLIQNLLPISVIVVQFNTFTQRLELQSSNKQAKKEFGISTDEQLQCFLNLTDIPLHNPSTNAISTIQNIKSFNHPSTIQGTLQSSVQNQNKYDKTQIKKLPIQYSYSDKAVLPSVYSIQKNNPSQIQSISINSAQKLNHHSISTKQSCMISPSVLSKLTSNTSGLVQNLISNIYSQRKQEEKYTLKQLLKSKLQRQVKLNKQNEISANQISQSKKDNKYSSNSDFQIFDEEEIVNVNWQKESQSIKKLKVKVSTFSHTENIAILIIENESIKSQMKQQEIKFYNKSNSWNQVVQRVEVAANQIVQQLSSSLQLFTNQSSSLPKKLTDILLISYHLLILNRNAKDYIQDILPSSSKSPFQTNPNNQQSQLTQQDSQNAFIQSNNNLQVSVSRSQAVPTVLNFNLMDSLSCRQLISNQESNMFPHIKNRKSIKQWQNQLNDIVDIDVGLDIKSWLAVMENKIQDKKLEVRLVIEDETSVICNDRDKFNRIFFNLLENSLKFSQKFGSILIKVSNSLQYNECIEIMIQNVIQQDVDIVKLTKEFDSLLNNQQVVQTYQQQFKLGLTVSQILIGNIGPSCQLRYSIHQDSITISYFVYQNLNILKPVENQIYHSNNPATYSGIQSSKRKQQRNSHLDISQTSTSYVGNKNNENQKKLLHLQKETKSLALINSLSNNKLSLSQSNSVVQSINMKIPTLSFPLRSPSLKRYKQKNFLFDDQDPQDLQLSDLIEKNDFPSTQSQYFKNQTKAIHNKMRPNFQQIKKANIGQQDDNPGDNKFAIRMQDLCISKQEVDKNPGDIQSLSNDTMPSLSEDEREHSKKKCKNIQKKRRFSIIKESVTESFFDNNQPPPALQNQLKFKLDRGQQIIKSECRSNFSDTEINFFNQPLSFDNSSA